MLPLRGRVKGSPSPSVCLYTRRGRLGIALSRSGEAAAVEEVLLGVGGVVAEVAGGPFADAAVGDGFAAEVPLADGPAHPDVDGKGTGLIKGEGEDTVRDLLADAVEG